MTFNQPNFQKDVFWAKQATQLLDNFKELKYDHFNFRCPYCGDSEKNKKKTRGYIYKSPKGILKYKCFNCNVGPMSITQFLREIDPIRYKSYVMDMFGSRKKEKEEPLAIPKVELPEFSNLTLRSAYENEAATEYLNSRKIPKTPKIKYLDNFTMWSVKEYGRELDYLPKYDPRVILVCQGYDDELIGFIARTTGHSTLRYNNIKLNPEYPNLVYGLNNINKDSTVRVVEGAFDSLFVDNCIALSSSALQSSEQYISKEASVLIWDNESRSKDITPLIGKAIDDGFSVVIWPPFILEKDINEMVLAGHENIDEIIENNTFSGLRAKMKFNDWKKI